MTARDKIIEMAREAGFDPHDMSDDFTCNLKDLTRFAALVRNAALEEAAERCENMTLYGPVAEVQQRYNQAYRHCSAAIREMKETK